MTNLNTVILQGNLTKDASDGMRTSKNGTAFGSFTLAVGRSFKNENDEWDTKTSFIRVKGFGKSYESAVKHLVKGSSAIVEGHLEQDVWEKDGQKHSEIVLVGEHFYPTWQKKNTSESSGYNKVNQQSTTNDDGFPEDLPF